VSFASRDGEPMSSFKVALEHFSDSIQEEALNDRLQVDAMIHAMGSYPTTDG